MLGLSPREDPIQSNFGGSELLFSMKRTKPQPVITLLFLDGWMDFHLGNKHVSVLIVSGNEEPLVPPCLSQQTNKPGMLLPMGGLSENPVLLGLFLLFLTFLWHKSRC